MTSVKNNVMTSVEHDGIKFTVSMSGKGVRATRKVGRTKYTLGTDWDFYVKSFREQEEKHKDERNKNTG
jgi:hypothetical protein